MSVPGVLKQSGFGATSRRDAWWLQPLAIVLGLGGFICYTTWAAFQGENYFYHEGGAHYLSPFYSPLLFGAEHEPRWFGAEKPSWWPDWMPFSAALLILIGPAGMRFTCYYYRGAYYKAFWADPPSCAVGEPRKGYWGEHRLPLLMQNAHRYFFYPAAMFVMILAYDAWCALWFLGEDGAMHFGVGLGSIVLILNAVFLGCYTFGCHVARHQIGGHLDCFSKARVRKACYDCVSGLNKRHMQWAWVSLVWVLLSDVYVRLCASGVLTDWRII